jgi:hypothetical protein
MRSLIPLLLAFALALPLAGQRTKINAARDVTGTLPIGNGGTGQTTQQAAIDALVPSQTSQSGKCLSTNGTTVSWQACGSGGSVSVQVGGSAVATEDTIDFQPGTGISIAGTNPTGQAEVTIAADTAVMLTRAQNQAGTDVHCKPSSGTNTLACTVSPALSAQPADTLLFLVPFANNTGPVTLDAGPGAMAVETGDSTALSADDLVAGAGRWIRSTGTEWRLVGLAPSQAGGGSVTASSTTTFTNKTIDADATGNVITNIGSSEVKSELITGQTDKTAPVGADSVMISDSAASGALKESTLKQVLDVLPLTKAVTIESPTSSEDITLFFTDVAITVVQLNAVCVGSTPSVTYTIRHGSDRSATGNEVVTSGSTTTSTTTGDEVTSFNDATIPADSWVWLETTAQSGTVASLNVTIKYTRD